MTEKKEQQKEEIFSKVVRAGKRTYFFDVKATRKGEHYLTITESKRKFNNEQGKFFYEKFKIFLYKEDFEKFSSAMTETLSYINKHNEGIPDLPEYESNYAEDPSLSATEEEPLSFSEETDEDDLFKTNAHTDLDFEDLGSDESELESNLFEK